MMTSAWITLPDGSTKIEARLLPANADILNFARGEAIIDNVERAGLDMQLTPDTAALKTGDVVQVPAVANRPARRFVVSAAREQDDRIIAAVAREQS